MGPGTAKSSLPCSIANLAEIIEPDLIFPSTRTVPEEIPVMIRFLRGKFLFVAGNERGNSLMIEPFRRICS
jgi:3,4-dihydroxy-2-butanone 4-phosphate synthase